MGAIAITLVVGTLLVLMGLALINGMEQNWLDLVVGTMVGDVSVTAKDASNLTVFPTTALLSIVKQPEVADATSRIEFQGILRNGAASTPATVHSIDVSHENRLVKNLRNGPTDMLGLSTSAGSWPIAISQQMAVDLGVGVGDVVDLSGIQLNGEPFRRYLTVAYIFEGNVKNEALNLWVLIPLENGRTLIGARDAEATSVRVFLKEPATAHATAAVHEALEHGLVRPDLVVQTWRQTDESTWLISLYVWRSILYFFIGILSLLIMIGSVGVISATMLERLREVGTMRALGMTPAQVIQTLMLELFIVGLLASAVAAGLSFLLTAAAHGGIPATTDALALSFGGKRLYPSLSMGVLGSGMLFTTTLAVLSGIGPILRSATMKEIDALRHV